jgi:hypothetical protein
MKSCLYIYILRFYIYICICVLYMLYIYIYIYVYLCVMSRTYTLCKIPCLGLSRALGKDPWFKPRINRWFAYPKSGCPCIFHVQLGPMGGNAWLSDSAQKWSQVFLDCHMMVAKPEEQVHEFRMGSKGLSKVGCPRTNVSSCFTMFHHVLSGLGLIRFHHDFHDSTCSFCVSLFVKLYELSAPFLDNPTGFWPITFGTHFLSTHEMTTRTAFLKITGRSLHEMAVTIFQTFWLGWLPCTWCNWTLIETLAPQLWSGPRDSHEISACRWSRLRKPRPPIQWHGLLIWA